MAKKQNPPAKSGKAEVRKEILRLSIEGEVFSVETCYKKMKTKRMHIQKDGTLSLSVPVGTPLSAISDFCKEYGKAIMNKRQKYIARPFVCATLTVAEGDCFSCFGETLKVCVQKGNQARAYREGNTLCLVVRDPQNSTVLQRRFAEWQKAETVRQMTTLCQSRFAAFAAAGVSFPKIEVKAMHANWGRCYYRDNRILFSTALMYCPPQYSLYVAVHELTHFLHPNHSPAFYATVGSILPQWKAYKAQAPILLSHNEEH